MTTDLERIKPWSTLVRIDKREIGAAKVIVQIQKLTEKVFLYRGTEISEIHVEILYFSVSNVYR